MRSHADDAVLQGYRDSASPTTCNYFSHIYHRPGNSPPAAPEGTDATYRRLVELEIPLNSTVVFIDANLTTHPEGRQAGRRDVLDGDGSVTTDLDLDESASGGSAEGPPDCLADCPDVDEVDCSTFVALREVFAAGTDGLLECMDDCAADVLTFVQEVVEIEAAVCDGGNCGSIEIFPPEALVERVAGNTELVPSDAVCTSECVQGELHLECNVTDLMIAEAGRRRLQDDSTSSTVSIPVSLNSQGDGFETVDFEDATVSTTHGAGHTAPATEAAAGMSGAGRATCNFGLLMAALGTAVAAGSQGAEMLGSSEVVGACASVAQEIADGECRTP